MGATRYVCSVYVIKTSVSLRKTSVSFSKKKYKLTKIFVMYVFSIFSLQKSCIN